MYRNDDSRKHLWPTGLEEQEGKGRGWDHEVGVGVPRAGLWTSEEGPLAGSCQYF